MLVDAIQTFSRSRGAEAAASVAFFAIFSLFPLLLFIVVGASFFLDEKVVQDKLIEAVQNTIPISSELITLNIRSVLQKRGSFSLVALVSLWWSASGMFNNITANLTRAWPQASMRNFIKRRLVALGFVSGLVGLLFISLIATTILDLLPLEYLPYWDTVSIEVTVLWKLFSKYVPILFRLLVFWVLYTWGPNVTVPIKAAFWGALLTTVGWELSTAVFSWYLGSGYSRYTLVYGSLSRIVVLLFWIYLSSWILLFGAHLTAAITRKKAALA